MEEVQDARPAPEVVKDAGRFGVKVDVRRGRAGERGVTLPFLPLPTTITMPRCPCQALGTSSPLSPRRPSQSCPGMPR